MRMMLIKHSTQYTISFLHKTKSHPKQLGAHPDPAPQTVLHVLDHVPDQEPKLVGTGKGGVGYLNAALVVMGAKRPHVGVAGHGRRQQGNDRLGGVGSALPQKQG